MRSIVIAQTRASLLNKTNSTSQSDPVISCGQLVIKLRTGPWNRSTRNRKEVRTTQWQLSWWLYSSRVILACFSRLLADSCLPNTKQLLSSARVSLNQYLDVVVALESQTDSYEATNDSPKASFSCFLLRFSYWLKDVCAVVQRKTSVPIKTAELVVKINLVSTVAPSADRIGFNHFQQLCTNRTETNTHASYYRL